MKTRHRIAPVARAGLSAPINLRLCTAGLALVLLAGRVMSDPAPDGAEASGAPPVPGIPLTIEGVLDFGGCSVGEVHAEKITIRHHGTQDVAVAVASVPEGFDVRPPVFGVPAGGRREIVVTFRPLATNTYSGDLQIKVGDRAIASRPVSGTGSRSEPGLLKSRQAGYSVVEGLPFIEVTVERVQGRDGDVSVEYATRPGGTATPRADFDPREGTLRWKQGDDAPKSFRIPIVDDAIYEGNENFMIALFNPKGGARIEGPTLIEVRILDNDTSSLR